jgi:hypothetical protein
LINPAAVKQYLGDIKLPGGLSPDEWDNFHDLIAIDEIARCGSLGVIWALGCGNAIGCPPLVCFGSAEQKERYLPAVLQGDSRFCLGITEAQGTYSASQPLSSSNTITILQLVQISAESKLRPVLKVTILLLMAKRNGLRTSCLLIIVLQQYEQVRRERMGYLF